MNDTRSVRSRKHAQILEAAEAEFRQYGYADAHMDRITERAGVSKRTVYKHFESKKNLFREIAIRVQQTFSDAVNVEYQPGLDTRAQLVALGQAEGRVLTSVDTMELTRLVISEVMRNPELALEAQEKIDLTATFEKFMRDAGADGALAIEDPAQAAQEFLGLLKHSTFWPVMFGAPVVAPETMAKVIENAVDMMMSRYGT